MKHKLIFRVVAVAMTLSILMMALPVSPALAARWIELYPDEGEIGDLIDIYGQDFPPSGGYGTPPSFVDIYFSSDAAAVYDEINVEVTTYKLLELDVLVDDEGDFGTSFNVPTRLTVGGEDVSSGTYYVYVTYAESDRIRASAEFTVVTGEITITPTSGFSGSTVTISGSGFSATKSVAITFDDVAITTNPASVTTDATGAFAGVTFTVPASVNGSHTVKAEDADANLAAATFTVGEEISVTSTSGFVDDTVTIDGSGFGATKSVAITFDDVALTTIPASVTTNSTGGFTATFTVPASANGAHTVKAEDADANSAIATFTIGEEISVTSTSGFVGDTVTVDGSGFGATKSVAITFDDVALTTDPASVTTNSTGGFTATFTVPAGVNGSYTVKAEDADTNSATATFTVGEKISVTPATGASGTEVSVNGSGFGTTKSVTITFNDVALTTNPASVTTNSTGGFTATFTVPASANGAHTVKAEDADTNLATATFTIGAGISVTSTSGFVGDTVTVDGSGFAASSSVTIYFDSTSVGTATTDATGAFAGVTLTVPASANGAHTVKAEDADTNLATAIFTVGEKISVNPTSGFVGDTVTVDGSGFGSTKSVTITFDDVALTTNPASVTTNSTGGFTATFTVPSSVNGSYTIKAQDSVGNSATWSFTIGEKITINPATGASVTEVSVNGTGFGASKTITIKYNNVTVSTNPATISTDASGSFSGSFSLPASPAGSYTVEVSDGTLSGSADFVAVAGASVSQTTSAASPGNAGMELTINGDGFKANTTVTVTYETTPVELATTTTDSHGSFSVAVTIPPSVGGAHTISATDGETTKQFDFVMEQQAPPTPQPLLPLGGDKAKQPVRFDWADVSDASLPLTYTLQIATDQNFTALVLEKTGLSLSEYTLAAAEKLESAGKDAPYYWRVQAVDGASNESSWTGAGEFNIGFVWPSMPDWAKYLLIGLGILVIAVVGFWFGMRTAYSSF